jgi:hypothetical protein
MQTPDAPQFEVFGFANLSLPQRAHFEASLVRHFLRFGAVAGTLSAGDCVRVHGDRSDGYPDLRLEPAAGGRLLVCDMAPPGRSLLARLRGFLRTYPRPVSFPPLSLRAIDDPPVRPPAPRQPLGDRVKTRVRLLGDPKLTISADAFLRGLLPALWDDSDLAAAVATAGKYVQWLAEDRLCWYPFALDSYRTRLLDLAGVRYQMYPWDAGADDLPALCAYCLAWLRSVPAVDPPGPPFLLRGSAALWQCPCCGGVFVDDPMAEKAGLRGMLSRRQLREGYGATPPAAVAAWALPAGLADQGD